MSLLGRSDKSAAAAQTLLPCSPCSPCSSPPPHPPPSPSEAGGVSRLQPQLLCVNIYVFTTVLQEKLKKVTWAWQ
ncbi:hypothetical protein CesoFtcFv8_025543 [Champsocephalus esox]|uniref:Uncharacterized protein n=1 Tax=Champsocephalus esox TaxID=159716 RepID=A0AAN8GF84_9TELE|nr:hypothetical protein CesoFtcFv8_025543 [Champsocephalus esox]